MQFKVPLVFAAIVILLSCTKPQDALFKAVESGDVDAALEAVGDGADPNLKDSDGSTALMIAAAESSPEMVGALLTKANEKGIRMLGKQHQESTDAVGIDPENVEASFGLAVEKNTGAVQAVFHEFYASPPGPGNATRYIYDENGVDLLNHPDPESGDSILHVENKTEVTVIGASTFAVDTATGPAHWTKVRVDSSGTDVTGWLLDTWLTEMKGGRLVRYENESRIIDATDGLNMRAYPALDSSRLLTIPGGAYVDLLAEFGEEITLAGTTGRWSQVDYKTRTGWVFGGYLRQPAGEPSLSISENTTFKAETQNFIKGRVGGVRYEEELKTLEGNQVTYTKTSYFSGLRDNTLPSGNGFDVFTHSGYYYVENDRIHFVFYSGSVESLFFSDYDAVSYLTRATRLPPPKGFSMECMLLEDEAKPGSMFIEVWKWQKVQSVPDKYEWDMSDSQFKYETDSIRDYIGYFGMTSGK